VLVGTTSNSSSGVAGETLIQKAGGTLIHIVKAALARCTGPQLRRWAPMEPEQVLATGRSACHRRLKQALLSRGPVIAVSGGPSAGQTRGYLPTRQRSVAGTAALMRSMSVGGIWLLPVCILLYLIEKWPAQNLAHLAASPKLPCCLAIGHRPASWAHGWAVQGHLQWSTPGLRGNVHHLELPRGLQRRSQHLLRAYVRRCCACCCWTTLC
jgi:hypothetical protein